MSIDITALRSSSSGNCVLIRTENTQILIDCGFKSQRDCTQTLCQYAGGLDDLHAVVVSHSHTDHIGYPALRVLAAHRVPIRAHQNVAAQICNRHGCEAWREPPILQPFNDQPFQVGDLRITPLEVPHAPFVPTFGFVIEHGEGWRRRKIVCCTDFYDYDGVLWHFMNADFIFVESNHDPDLLREHPNPASWYHMSNPKVARLLSQAIYQSQRPPQAVMLGHLSNQRNREQLALDAVGEVFAQEGLKMEFRLCAASKYEPSGTIHIN